MTEENKNDKTASVEEAAEQAPLLTPEEQLARDYAELDSKFQRLRADYANYQKRVPKMIADEVNYKVESFIKALLPGLDNFEHALKHSENSEDVKSVLDGVKMVYANIIEILKSQELEIIESKGAHFEPSYHQAVVHQSVETEPDGIVLEELQKGYMIKGKVIRPAMVVVNKIEHKEDAPAPEGDA